VRARSPHVELVEFTLIPIPRGFTCNAIAIARCTLDGAMLMPFLLHRETEGTLSVLEVETLEIPGVFSLDLREHGRGVPVTDPSCTIEAKRRLLNVILGHARAKGIR
jgi:hypothetical protein